MIGDWLIDHPGKALLGTLAACVILGVGLFLVVDHFESEDEKAHPYSEWNRVITGYHLCGRMFVQDWHWERKK